MVLRFRGLEKSYNGTLVLRGVSAEFVSQRVGALVGPNGAGKTTLLRILAGLQRADCGTVEARNAVYYGGFDTMPVRGTICDLRRSLGLGPIDGGRRRLSQLSRGQLHQTGLDIAFELRSEILLLDEPWTALEPDARELLNQRIRDAVDGGRILLCSTHDLDEVARIASDVAFLRDGYLTLTRPEDHGSEKFDRNELLQLYRGDRR